MKAAAHDARKPLQLGVGGVKPEPFGGFAIDPFAGFDLIFDGAVRPHDARLPNIGRKG
jgi:hypothetical protein